MSEFNSCAHLVRDADEPVINSIDDNLNQMLAMQNRLQEELAGKYPGRALPPLRLKTKGQLVDFLLDQKQAFDDEFNELILSIAGTSKPANDQSAVWKKWKSNYDSLRSEEINEGLSEDEITERNFEMVDIMHFVFNMLLAVGLDSDKLHYLYMLKNEENLRRYNSGY